MNFWNVIKSLFTRRQLVSEIDWTQFQPTDDGSDCPQATPAAPEDETMSQA